MRVVALHAEDKERPGACELYRVNQPFHYLNRSKDWQVEYDTMNSVFNEWYVNAVAGDHGLSVYQFLSAIDVLVLPRLRAEDNGIELVIDDMFVLAQELGVKVVYEVDDDFTNQHRKVIQGSMEAVASRCDAVTVTTPYLAETMRTRLGLPTYVLPNMLSPLLWRDGEVKRNLSEEHVVIWLSGSATHVDDWNVLEDVFPALLQKHPHARLVICGFHPDYLQDIEGVEYMDGVDYRVYAQIVRQVDIVLAPVDPNDQFNMGKSPIKSVEGMGAVRKVHNQFCGAAVIATDNPVYRLAIRNGHDGLLVEHTPEAWTDALDKLLTDADYRFQLQRNAYNTVWKKGKWDINRNWTLWADAYRKIAAQPKRKIRRESVSMTYPAVRCN